MSQRSYARYRRGGFVRPRGVGSVMVASQGVEPQQNAEMYCGPVHSPYGDYYQENQYYVHPEMCPAHVCAIQGEFGKGI